MILTSCSSRNCIMTFIIGRGFAERQILKKWKWAFLFKWVEYFNCCVNIDIDKIYPKRLRNDIFHWSRLCRAPNSEKVIMALSLELSGILWWNFAYILILTRCTPWDCQMTFEFGWVFLPRCKFWKKWDYCKTIETIAKWHLSSVEALPSAKFWKCDNGLISWTEWNILIDFCLNIDIIKI